jgi:hypothetical protein
MRCPFTCRAAFITLLLLVCLPLRADDEEKKRFAELKKTLNNVKLVGNFTVVGEAADKGLTREEYTIKKVEKQKEGDYWRIHARIKYGGQDVELPLDLEIKWAGNTPVITLDKVTIPFLGTFDARVVIINGKYAGTWSHGKVGGHLFGTIEKIEEEKKEEKDGN